MASWDQQRGWATEVQKDFKWMARLEVGVNPTVINLLYQAKEAIKKRWITRVKTATQAAIQMQATDDDLESIEKYNKTHWGQWD